MTGPSHETPPATDATRPADHRRLHVEATTEAVHVAVETLRRRGERVTAARRVVIEALAGSPDHLTADEVAAMVGGSDVHRATVYRTLELLRESGFVSQRRAAGSAAEYHFSMKLSAHGHLHAHCRQCGMVVTIAADALDRALPAVSDSSGFRLEPENTLLVGLCRDCHD